MTDVRTTHEVAVPSPRPRPRVPEESTGREDEREDERALIGYPGVRYALAHCPALRPRPGGGAVPTPRS